MKRKGFLKKIIGALCAVGILMSMPVTANAADKADVLGEWDGNSRAFPITFYENGIAEDSFNPRPYHMESGTLTFKYYGSGQTDTVHYDLWRGEKIGSDVPTGENADAVIFVIIGSGTMKSWNVWKEANSNEWYSYDPVILTKVTEDKKTKSKKSKDKKADEGSAGAVVVCEHQYEWTVTAEPTETADGVSSYICISCGDVKETQPISASTVIRSDLLASIKNAAAGTTVTFDNQAWFCYPQYVLDTLKEKGDVSLKTDFTCEGVHYSFTIPAGSDYTNLEQADFYGFMYLYGAFGGMIVE